MSKRVFMFPGQGSQYIGMGKEFYDTMPNAKAVIDLASEQTGLDIPALCFEENDKLNITEYTQICMLAVEAAIYQAIIDKGITPDVTAGLSLGEYGALIASGAMTMADAFAVVRKRGIYMQEAVPTGGAMTAVLGLDPQVIEDICKKTADETNSVVSVANYNCPGQIVITGEKAAVDAAAAACSEAGAKRCVPLKVSGPFHSAMLKGAGEKLADALESVEIHDIKVPYITNVTADYVKSPADVIPQRQHHPHRLRPQRHQGQSGEPHQTDAGRSKGASERPCRGEAPDRRGDRGRCAQPVSRLRNYRRNKKSRTVQFFAVLCGFSFMRQSAYFL